MAAQSKPCNDVCDQQSLILNILDLNVIRLSMACREKKPSAMKEDSNKKRSNQVSLFLTSITQTIT